MQISPSDRALIRDLAKQVAEIAALPVMAERFTQWTDIARELVADA